jgi:hypothetical protein
MLVYLIENRSADSLPVYYAPGRNNGSGPHAWSTEKREALGFAEEFDAQRFIDAVMPRMADTLRPVPHGRT